MDGVIRWLSTGAIADAVCQGSRLVTRRAQDHALRRRAAEAVSLEGRSARVTEILGGDMIAELLDGHERQAGGLSRVKLTPRHAGWTPFSLMLTGIAVVVQDESEHARVR